MPSSWATAAQAAVRQYNAAVLDLRTRDPRISVVDLYWPVKLAMTFTPENLVVGHHHVARHGFGNDLDHIFLKDRRHVGTVVQGLLANLFLDAVDARCARRTAPTGKPGDPGLRRAGAGHLLHEPGPRHRPVNRTCLASRHRT